MGIVRDIRIAKIEMEERGLCDECHDGHFHFRAYCGCEVCDKCGQHKGLAQCYCGWKAGGGHASYADFDEPIDAEE